MYRTCLWFVFSVAFCFVGLISGQEPEDETGKVYEGLGELISERDAVRKNRYAFVATGEVTINAHPPVIKPFYVLRIVSGKDPDFDYRANGFVMSQGGISAQRWDEKCFSEGKLKAARGVINPGKRYHSPIGGQTNQDFLSDFFRGKFGNLEPFEDIILIGNELEGSKPYANAVEKKMLRSGEFLSSRFDENGNVESKWKMPVARQTCETTLVQGKKNKYLPIEIRYQGVGDFDSFFSHTACEWKKHGEHMVPSRVESACVSWSKDGPFVRHWVLKIDWLIGDEVPDSFLNFEQGDFRESLRKHFDLDFDRVEIGRMIRAQPWESPKELAKPFDHHLN